jgi:hypothetical protein
LFFCLSLFLPGLIIGFDFNATLLYDWQKTLTETDNNSIAEDYGRQSLSSFIPALFMETPIQFNLRRNLFTCSPETVKVILNAVRLCLLFIVALALGKPFKKSESKAEVLFGLALVCLCIPLIFPHQGKYATLFVLPAYTYTLCALAIMSSRKTFITQLILLATTFVLLTLTTDGVIGRQLSNICEYFNFITLGSLLLLCQLLTLRFSKAC